MSLANQGWFLWSVYLQTNEMNVLWDNCYESSWHILLTKHFICVLQFPYKLSAHNISGCMSNGAATIHTRLLIAKVIKVKWDVKFNFPVALSTVHVLGSYLRFWEAVLEMQLVACLHYSAKCYQRVPHTVGTHRRGKRDRRKDCEAALWVDPPQGSLKASGKRSGKS